MLSPYALFHYNLHYFFQVPDVQKYILQHFPNLDGNVSDIDSSDEEDKPVGQTFVEKIEDSSNYKTELLASKAEESCENKNMLSSERHEKIVVESECSQVTINQVFPENTELRNCSENDVSSSNSLFCKDLVILNEPKGTELNATEVNVIEKMSDKTGDSSECENIIKSEMSAGLISESVCGTLSSTKVVISENLVSKEDTSGFQSKKVDVEQSPQREQFLRPENNCEHQVDESERLEGIKSPPLSDELTEDLPKITTDACETYMDLQISTENPKNDVLQTQTDRSLSIGSDLVPEDSNKFCISETTLPLRPNTDSIRPDETYAEESKDEISKTFAFEALDKRESDSAGSEGNAKIIVSLTESVDSCPNDPESSVTIQTLGNPKLGIEKITHLTENFEEKDSHPQTSLFSSDETLDISFVSKPETESTKYLNQVEPEPECDQTDVSCEKIQMSSEQESMILTEKNLTIDRVSEKTQSDISESTVLEKQSSESLGQQTVEEDLIPVPEDKNLALCESNVESQLKSAPGTKFDTTIAPLENEEQLAKLDGTVEEQETNMEYDQISELNASSITEERTEVSDEFAGHAEPNTTEKSTRVSKDLALIEDSKQKISESNLLQEASSQINFRIVKEASELLDATLERVAQEVGLNENLLKEKDAIQNTEFSNEIILPTKHQEKFQLGTSIGSFPLGTKNIEDLPSEKYQLANDTEKKIFVEFINVSQIIQPACESFPEKSLAEIGDQLDFKDEPTIEIKQDGRFETNLDLEEKEIQICNLPKDQLESTVTDSELTKGIQQMPISFNADLIPTSVNLENSVQISEGKDQDTGKYIY